MGKINTSIASNNLSNLSFYIDLEQSVNYTFPFEISTSVPGPIYARIKNTGAGTITIRARQIIFFMGQPGVGSEYDVATIDPNETKYFQVSSRYLPLTYVSWNTFLNIKIGGKTSIKKQNLTVSGYGIALVNGIYKLQNTLINGRNWYLHDSLLFNVRWNNSTSRWNLLSNQSVELSVTTNSTDNPWEATWSNNVQVSSGSGGKISLKSSAIPLNTLNIRVNNGPSNAPWGVGGSGPCGNDFQLLNNQNGIWSQGHLGCDFYVAWDNNNGTLPYRWRLYYDSDGRTDYASHPTATQEALPSRGWDNGMTISIV